MSTDCARSIDVHTGHQHKPRHIFDKLGNRWWGFSVGYIFFWGGLPIQHRHFPLKKSPLSRKCPSGEKNQVQKNPIRSGNSVGAALVLREAGNGVKRSLICRFYLQMVRRKFVYLLLRWIFLQCTRAPFVISVSEVSDVDSLFVPNIREEVLGIRCKVLY